MKIGIALTHLIMTATAISEPSAGTYGVDKLGWGPRAGEETTVFSRSGIDTSNAVILLKQTRQDAEYYCDAYLNSGGDCIDDVLRPKKTKKEASEFCEKYLKDPTSGCADGIIEQGMQENIVTLTADCLSGKFQSFWGPRLFLGKTDDYKGPLKLPADTFEPYLIIGRDGIVEHGYVNEDYDVDSLVFVALCPSRMPELAKEIRSK